MTKSKRHGPLRIITVNIPEDFLMHIQRLMDRGKCPSRSEYIRWSVGNQISRDSETQRYMEEFAKDEPMKIKVPKGMTFIKGFNSNKPFITTRLEKPEDKEVYY